MNLLARREHAILELRRKLCNKGFEAELVDQALQGLVRDNLLNDERFAEAYVQGRAVRGYGPLRIRSELRERGVVDELIERYVDSADEQWVECTVRARHKRFGGALPQDFQERARQARFLQYRGFTADQIRRVLKEGAED